MTTNKYQFGKIYKIISPNTDKIYIGSTTYKYLAQRKAVHSSQYKRWKNDPTFQYCSSYDLYDLGDVDYILIESYNCNTKDELLTRERYWIEHHQSSLVNKNIPTRTYKEIKEKMNQYYKNNEEYREYKKQYYKANKDKIKEKMKQYYKSNKNI